MAEPISLTNLRKRRGITKASITRLDTNLTKLEHKTPDRSIGDLAQRMTQKLNSLDDEFKSHHYSIIDAIDETDEETLDKEQGELDEHDDIVSDLFIRIDQLAAECNLTADPNAKKTVVRQFSYLKTVLAEIQIALQGLTADSAEIPLLQHYEERLSECKGSLAETRQVILSMELTEDDEIELSASALDKTISECGLQLKRLAYVPRPVSSEVEVPTTMAPKGVRLPKIEVPTFDGNLVNLRTFWEQFRVAVHDRPRLSNTEKLVYLRHSVKDGSAMKAIEGLSQSGDQYADAISCLRSRYDRPRLIHQTHVRKIVEIAPLKEGSGKELRYLHDVAQQHLRALKAMEQEPSGSFITSMLELKLDQSTMFEWQRFSQDNTEVPHYNDLLKFLDLRAQASETISSDVKRTNRSDSNQTRCFQSNRSVTSHAANTTSDSCVVCKNERHPLYVCTRFKSFPHEKMIFTLKSNQICFNCLRPGHVSNKCPSSNRCKECQRLHHTLLHKHYPSSQCGQSQSEQVDDKNKVSSNVANGLISNSLLMTCQIFVKAPDGSPVKARALLDSGSSSSFISERMGQSLCLPRTKHKMNISGIAGLSHHSSRQAVASFHISSIHDNAKAFPMSAIVLPRVTCDLPTQPVFFNSQWTHLDGLKLADPDFGRPGKIDSILGVDIYTNALLDGRRSGPVDSPVAFETVFGWVLAGKATTDVCSHISVSSHHASVEFSDDVLRKFWEIEESPKELSNMSCDERSVIQHFERSHKRTEDGKFIVPLPKKSHYKPIGESRSHAVRRFQSMEKSLYSKGYFQEFSDVMTEYFDMGHAEIVPAGDLQKPAQDVFYLPMHTVRKEHSTTTKVRIVFDASAKSASNVSLNDILLVGPTVHPALVDVLLRFRFHRIALTADVSKMYRAILLDSSDRDLHRFVWRKSPDEPLLDYRMTRLTFGVSASSFAANMSIKQNALDLEDVFPQAKKVIDECFYVDDCLTGADSVQDAIKLQQELQDLFTKGGFFLRKWNSSELSALDHLSPSFKDVSATHKIPGIDQYTKTLGIEWNTNQDYFRLTVSKLPPIANLTKRSLVADIAKTFDVLGWFSPTIIKMKILLQQLWEQKIDWDDQVPQGIVDIWFQWRSELPILMEKKISRCYFDKNTHIVSVQLHGFSDASERAFAAVIYLRMVDSSGNIQVSLVISKTKVAPIKRLTIPRLELCGAHLMAQLLNHTRQVFQIPLSSVFAWTDSTIVLNWLVGSSKRFKTYVGNRISYIVDLISPERWNHVNGVENPADSASRGLFPSELLEHSLWWNGPAWLKKALEEWPKKCILPPNCSQDEKGEICLHVIAQSQLPVAIPVKRYSSFVRLKRVTAWILRFIRNSKQGKKRCLSPTLTCEELFDAEVYWVSVIQRDYFQNEVSALAGKRPMKRSSSLISLCPFIDSNNLLRVGGRLQRSDLPYFVIHPLIIHGSHPITRLIIRTEHQRLLHAGPTSLSASLSNRYHILNGRKSVRSVTRGCVTCRKTAARPQPQMMGQLPIERVTPGSVFGQVGVDFAGPIYIKYGYTRKSTIIKAYISVFVSLSVKATHLEIVSNLTTDAFLAALRRFVSRRGKPRIIWSDHGSNFIGASRELKELAKFLEDQKIQHTISQFCSNQGIQWKYILERSPNFGGLWEAAVKSMKTHLKRAISDHKLTFEEMSTILAQVEACLNSRPLTPLPDSSDGVEALTPGHFLIGKPMEAIPDPAVSYQSVSVLRNWHLCQAITRHFWKRWSTEYVTSLRRYAKWYCPSRNIQVGDVVVLQEDNIIPTKWPLARVTQVHTGSDGFVRVVTIKTVSGTYKRPVTKLALLLPNASSPKD